LPRGFGARARQDSVGAREVLVHYAPILSRSHENVRAPAAHEAPLAETYGPIKRGHGNGAAEVHLRLLNLIGYLWRASQVVVKGLCERAETAYAVVSRGGEPDKVSVKHFHCPADVTAIDRARLFAFCFEDLLSDAIRHGSPRRPVLGWGTILAVWPRRWRLGRRSGRPLALTLPLKAPSFSSFLNGFPSHRARG